MNLQHLMKTRRLLVLKNGIKVSVALFFLLLFTPVHANELNTSKPARYKVRGVVFDTPDGNKEEKLEFATVFIPEYTMGTSTDSNGNFALENVPAGKVKLSVRYVGRLDLDTLIQVDRDLTLKLVMSKENFRLNEVIVTAVNSQVGQSTASKISRNAIDHLQATNLGDVLSLLPGGLTTNQQLNNAKQATLRDASMRTNDASVDMNAFGLSIIKNGAPISNNANLQTMNPTVSGGAGVLGGGTPPSGGVDLRLISTDNIESIEVIRGIPSVQYGDLTSGAIILNSKAGRSPLNVRAKVNPNVYEVSANSGFSLGGKKGALNVSGDYAHNTNDIKQSYLTYQRSNLSFLYSNRFFNRLTNNTSLDLMYGADRRKRNPDDETTKTFSKGDNLGLRLSTNGILRVSKPWLTNVRYTSSISYTSKKSYYSQQHQAANYPYSMTTTDGAVLSNRPGVDVFDKNGNKITNIPAGEEGLYAIELPSTYVSRYDIDGKELNAFVKLTGNLYKRIGNTNHSIMLGVDYKTDGNLGDGKTFSQTAPPPRPSTDNASFRPRRYKDIPFVQQLGAFIEEDFRIKFADRTLNITGGLRYDNISVVKEVFSPRVNASFEILPATLFVRGGYGVTAKAPSALYLYPEQAYFEYVNINELATESIPEDQRLLITTTRVFDSQNRDLKIARNKKAEVGFDLKIKQASLHVRAFNEKLVDGYTMDYTVNSFKPLMYNQYTRTSEGLVLTSNPVLAKYYTPTNNLQVKTEGVEFDLNLGRFDAIRTAFSINGMWAASEVASSGYTFFDGNSGSAGNNRTHVGIYEPGMDKQNNQKFTTTLRVTHNIPEIGFVITLTGQALWQDWRWNTMGNDSIPVKYISKDDGLVYDFDAGLIDWNNAKDPFRLILRKVDDKKRIREQYPPAYTFNINVTKELGENMRVSFFANNMFRSYPSVRSKRNPSEYLTREQKIFFGIELSLTL